MPVTTPVNPRSRERGRHTERHRRRLLAFGVCAVLCALATAGPARADSVTDWDQIAADALQSPGTATPPGAGQGAPSIAHLAMVHAAVYDAVNAIDGGRQPYASSPAAEPWYSQDAAVAAAAHHVLVNGGLGVPAARLATIDTAYQAALDAIAAGPAKAGGIATGEAAAAALLAARAGDGRFGPFRFSVGSLPGEWRPTSGVNDPFAWLKDVRPFVLRDPDRVRGRPPHGLRTRAYAADFNEVKAIGSAGRTVRTAGQTAVAQYWGLTNGTATISSILRSVAIGQGGTRADHARLLARAYTSAADALIVTWRDKARYSFWRPITAIHEAAGDGNDATQADPNWTPLIAAPPYPDQPSGLSALGCAVANSLQHFYRRDQATFSGTTLGGVTRTFTRFSKVCADIVDARVWAGIHFRFADEQGAKIGRRVAHWDNRHAFR
jgi:hypothetical protein